MKHFKLRIGWTMVAAYLLIAAAALALLYFSYSQQMDRLQATTEGSAAGTAEFIGRWIQPEVQKGDWGRVQQWLADYSLSGIDFRFQVVLPDGRLTVDSKAQAPIEDPGAVNLARQALTLNLTQFERLAPQVYRVAAPVRSPDGAPQAALMSTVDWSVRYRQQGDLLLHQGLWAALFILGVLTLAAVGLWTLSISPIRRLRRLAEQITRLGTSPRAPSFPTRELDQLANSFNEMLDRLSEQRTTLDKVNRQLERTVDERTHQLEGRNRELLTLNRISAIALAARSRGEAYQAIVRELSAATGFPMVSIERYDPERQVMIFEAFTGFRLPAGNGISGAFEAPASAAPSGWAARSGKILAERDLAAHPDYSALDPALQRLNIRTFVCAPMKLEGGPRSILGAISLAHPEVVELDDGLEEWISALANHIANLHVRLQAEGALEESAERFKLALESTGLAVWDWDLNSGKVITNERWVQVLGYQPGEGSADFSNWKEGIHPEDYPRVMEALQAHLSGKAVTFAQELRVRSGSGAWKWMAGSGMVVKRDEQGRPLQMVGTMLDIDEQRRASEMLRKRDAILEAVTTAAENFLSTESWETSLPGALEGLGRATQASRVYVFEAFQDLEGRWLSRLHSEWASVGVPLLEERESSSPGVPLQEKESPRVIAFQAAGLGRWEVLFSEGQDVRGRLSSFPESEQIFLARRSVRSLLAVPVFVGSRWWGYIGLDDCMSEREWLAVEEDALKLAAGVLGAAIQRQQTEEVVRRLYETEREQRKLSQVLREAGTAFSATLDFDRILDKLLDELPRVAPYDAAHVLLLSGSRAYLARQRGYTAYDPDILHKTAGRPFELARSPALRWMIERQQPLVVTDTRLAPGLTRLMDNDPFRSWAAAPVLIQGQVVAIFCLEKLEPYFYRPDQAEMLALFASQVGLALQNARLFTETMEALEREHNLHAVTQAISSNLELPAILQNVVRLACELASADSGAMAVLSPDGGSISYPYLYNLPFTLGTEVEQKGQSMAWQVIESGLPVCADEYATHPLARIGWVQSGVKACLAVPVMAGESRLGVLGLFSYNPEKRFGPREVALIESVGRQAGVAIQNARLFEASETRARESEMLRQAMSEVTSALELDAVLEKILVSLGTVVPFFSSAIFLYEGNHLRLMAGHNLPNPDLLLNHTFPAENPLFAEMKRSVQPLILADAQNDPRFERWGANNQTRGWMGLPLRVHGEPIGYMTLDSLEDGAYKAQDAALVQAFADEAAIAIENARLFQQVQQLAITDPLTGLHNRRYFFEAARRELERARRYQNPLGVVLLDIDHFKRVNDTYGHLAGDRVLTTVAHRCRESLREADISARYGGEEYVFLLPETNLEGAYQLAERLRLTIMSQPFDIGGKNISISVSLGVAELDEDCVDMQALIRRADLALYVTKDTGRGRVSRWNQEMGQP